MCSKSGISILCLLLSAVLFGCGHSDTPPAEAPLYINAVYSPASVGFEKSDKEMLEVCREWYGKTFVIRSADQFPDDPIGFSDSYSYINFDRNTLLIAYQLHSWTIDTYSNLYFRNNLEKTYDWTISLGSTEYHLESESMKLTRFAILVPKLPENADVRIWYSMQQIGPGNNWD